MGSTANEARVVNQGMDEAQLAEAAFGDEVIVYWHDGVEPDDPIYPKQKSHRVATELLQSVAGFDTLLTPFLCALIDLMATDQQDSTGEPAFDVRLDAKVCDQKEHFSGFKRNHRHYRILVRPMVQPLMGSEIAQVLDIASRYELAACHSNVGIEIWRPDDL